MWFDWKNWNFERPKNDVIHEKNNIDIDFKYNSVYFFIFVAVALFLKIYFHFSDETLPFCSVEFFVNKIDFWKSVFVYTYNIPDNFPPEFVCDFRISNALSYFFFFLAIILKSIYEIFIRIAIFDKNSKKMLILFTFVFLILFFLQKIDFSNPDIFQYNSYSRFENGAFTTTIMLFFCLTFLFYYMVAALKAVTIYALRRFLN